MDCFGGFLRLVPITFHDVAAANANLSHLIDGENSAGVVLDADFDSQHGHAYGTGLPWTANLIQRNNRAGLAQAVAFDQGDWIFGRDVFQNLDRQRRVTTDAKAE